MYPIVHHTLHSTKRVPSLAPLGIALASSSQVISEVASHTAGQTAQPRERVLRNLRWDGQPSPDRCHEMDTDTPTFFYCVGLCDLLVSAEMKHHPIHRQRRLTILRTDFFEDSCNSPAMMSSSRICSLFSPGVPCLRPHHAATRTHGVRLLEVEDQVELAHLFGQLSFQFVPPGKLRLDWTCVAKIPIENLDITMYNFQRDQLVVSRRNGADEEQRGITSVNDLGVCVVRLQSTPHPSSTNPTLRISQNPPLYSRKLHILVRRASTSCVTSLTIFDFCLVGKVWNHLARRTFPRFRISRVGVGVGVDRAHLDGTRASHS